LPDLNILLPFLIQGLAFGAMYAATGTGLVVLYRTTGVVNLAFGAIGAMSAHITWSVMGGSLANPNPVVGGLRILSYPLLVLLCSLITLAYGWFIAPRLAKRDPLAKSLGMVAVALFLLGIMKDRWDSSKPRELPFPSQTFKLGGTVVSTTQIVALLFSLAVVVLITIFLNKTATGTAMRAIANDREISGLVGVPVRRVEAVAWAGAGALCGCVYLLLPSFVKSLDQGTLTWFVIPALAGAIVGRFQSLWITFFASLVVGTLESGFTPFNGNLQFLSDFRRLVPVLISVGAILWVSRKRTVVLGGREMQ
jgi:branched-chain amino acid transport system permease protein